MFTDSVQTPEPVNHGIFSTVYNYVASGIDAVTNGIGNAILMDGVHEPGFETNIHRGRVTVQFAKSMGGAEPEDLIGLIGDARNTAQLRMFRSIMKAAGLDDDQVLPGETPDTAVLVDATNNALRVAKYESYVAGLSPPQWSL